MQRIAALSISPSLQYFGRSMSARLDMDGDDLIDLAVGAQGSVVLLRWVQGERVKSFLEQIFFHSHTYQHKLENTFLKL